MCMQDSYESFVGVEFTKIIWFSPYPKGPKHPNIRASIQG